MGLRLYYFISFLSIVSIYFVKSNSFLTNHELDELYGEIKQLHIMNQECNNKYKKLIIYLIERNISFNASDFLTPTPYFHN
jgi:hypothetical protein